MILKCRSCNHIFYGDDIKRWTEPHGEDNSGCPVCMGTYDEAYCCKMCDRLYLEDELINGICDDCLQQYGEDFSTCLLLGNRRKDNISINSFLATMFDEEFIEKILQREAVALKRKGVLPTTKFLKRDKRWFASALRKEVCYKNDK